MIISSVAESKSKHALPLLVASIKLYLLLLSKFKSWDYKNMIPNVCSKIVIWIEGVYGVDCQNSNLLNELLVNNMLAETTRIFIII